MDSPNMRRVVHPRGVRRVALLFASLFVFINLALSRIAGYFPLLSDF